MIKDYKRLLKQLLTLGIAAPLLLILTLGIAATLGFLLDLVPVLGIVPPFLSSAPVLVLLLLLVPWAALGVAAARRGGPSRRRTSGRRGVPAPAPDPRRRGGPGLLVRLGVLPGPRATGPGRRGVPGRLGRPATGHLDSPRRRGGATLRLIQTLGILVGLFGWAAPPLLLLLSGRVSFASPLYLPPIMLLLLLLLPLLLFMPLLLLRGGGGWAALRPLLTLGGWATALGGGLAFLGVLLNLDLAPALGRGAALRLILTLGSLAPVLAVVLAPLVSPSRGFSPAFFLVEDGWAALGDGWAPLAHRPSLSGISELILFLLLLLLLIRILNKDKESE